MFVLWVFLVLICSFGFYIAIGAGDECNGIDRVGFAGIHTLLFGIFYYISCVYLFHYERLKGSPGKRKFRVANLLLAIIPVFFPILMIGLVGSECRSHISVLPTICLIPLLLLLSDNSGKIKKRVVDDFELRTGGSGGDLFKNYPPNRVEDIYFIIWIFLCIFAVLALINIF